MEIEKVSVTEMPYQQIKNKKHMKMKVILEERKPSTSRN